MRSICERMVASGLHFLLVPDKILVARWFGLVELEEVPGFLSRHRQQEELLFTASRAAPELIELADIVTDRPCVKHPFDSGIPDRAGIEY